jgi:hypothetical protein
MLLHLRQPLMGHINSLHISSKIPQAISHHNSQEERRKTQRQD